MSRTAKSNPRPELRGREGTVKVEISLENSSHCLKITTLLAKLELEQKRMISLPPEQRKQNFLQKFPCKVVFQSSEGREGPFF